VRIIVVHCLISGGHAHLHLLQWNFTLRYSILMKMPIYNLHSTLFFIHTSHSMILLLIYQSILSSVPWVLNFVQVIYEILFFLRKIFAYFIWRTAVVFWLLQENLLVVDGRVVVHVVIKASVSWFTWLNTFFCILPGLSHIIVIGKVVSSINSIPTYKQCVSLPSLILRRNNTWWLRINTSILLYTILLSSTIHLH
jgi:hypothetical protein